VERVLGVNAEKAGEARGQKVGGGPGNKWGEKSGRGERGVGTQVESGCTGDLQKYGK